MMITNARVLLVMLWNWGFILGSATEAVRVSFKDWMTSRMWERKKERKKKNQSTFPYYKKKLWAGNFFFGRETETCMTQRMSSSPDTWLLLNTIGVHCCRHHVQGILLEDFFLQCFQPTINLLFWGLNGKSYKFNVYSKQTFNNWNC